MLSRAAARSTRAENPAVGAEGITQEEVDAFYGELVFPSQTSHSAYSRLVTDDLAGKRVGDFGCGQSLFEEDFRRLGCDAIFLDVSEKILETIEYGTKRVASLTDIPMADEEMDCIFCIGVVHHIPEMERAIDEMLRVLKPDGRLVLGVYAPGTPHAILRSAYDRARTPIGRVGLRALCGGLIWARNAKNGLLLGSSEHRRRVSDLLDSPLARYLTLDTYRSILVQRGGRVVRAKRISQMNVLTVEKRTSRPPTRAADVTSVG